MSSRDDVLNTEDVNEMSGFTAVRDELETVGVLLERDEVRAREVVTLGIERAQKTGGYYCPVMEEGRERKETIPVHWVTRITETNRVRSPFIAYGNEASLGHIYGNAALSGGAQGGSPEFSLEIRDLEPNDFAMLAICLV
ncbi:hypothetical protein FB451DRAFT_1167828 [Mycena latifolia]|nr:hypothetical protein FB451DRAFT_1167828 [Mycena latifolia]